jgi:hypothetical protein
LNATVQAAVAATLAAPLAKTSTAQSGTTIAPMPTVATVSAPKAPATFTPPRGTPIPSPTPTIIASVLSKDGKAFEIADVGLEKYWSQSVAWGSPSPSTVEWLELYANLTTVQIAFDKIKRIEVTSSKDAKFRVTLVSGESLEGTVQRRDEATFRDCYLKGKTTMHGYSAGFSTGFYKVASIDFRSEQGGVLATVTTDKGDKTEISQPKCEVEARPTFSGASRTMMLDLTIGTSTLNIPWADISKIVISAKDATLTLTLRNGKELVGRAAERYFITGKITVSGLPASFYASFDDLLSITFR